MSIIRLNKDSDTLGMIASILCMLHCLAAPLFLIAPTTSVLMQEEDHTNLWGLLDLIFLAISFVAIYWSARTTSKREVKYALWTAWLLLFVIVMNEKFELLPLPEFVIYPVTIVLIVLHYYNLRYCRCKDEKCCSN